MKFEDPLLDHLIKLASDLHPNALDTISTKLLSMDSFNEADQLSAGIVNLSHKFAIELLVQTMKEQGEISPSQLGFGLLTARRSSEKASSEISIEPVWTGLPDPSTKITRLDVALLDMVKESKKTLTLVTFVAYSVPSLAKVLLDASNRNVTVRLILESQEESGGQIKLNPLKVLRQSVPDAAVYYWPNENRPTTETGGVGLLHAKCAVADDNTALISSANLTGHAFEYNMEMGILVKGGTVPKTIADHFNHLIVNGTLQLYEGT